MNDTVFVELDEAYVNEIATIHADSLSGDILPALGYDFLTQYYQYVLRNHSQVVIGAISKEKLTGFCQLSFSPITVTDILRFTPLTVFQIARLALLNTRLFISGILLALNHHKETLTLPEISFIAVCPDYQGQNIGKRLVKTVNKIAAKRGEIQLNTKTSNKIARIMYEKSFNAHVITTKVILDKKYWYLSWKTDEQVR